MVWYYHLINTDGKWAVLHSSHDHPRGGGQEIVEGLSSRAEAEKQAKRLAKPDDQILTWERHQGGGTPTYKAIKVGSMETSDPKEVLCDLMACLKAAYTLLWAAHWKAEGNPSYGDHLLFERLYTALPGQIDTLAEKITARFGTDAINIPELVQSEQELISIAEETPDLAARALMIERALQATIRDVMTALEAADELSLGLDDYLATLANDHDTHVYLLQQRLRPAGRVAARFQQKNPTPERN